MSFHERNKKQKRVSSDYNDSRSKLPPIAMVAPELKQNMDQTEITKTCAVIGCEEYKNLNEESFFRFPEDPNLQQIWTDLTGRMNWLPTDYSYICIHHFSLDCFDTRRGVLLLKSTAIPSLKLPKHVLEVEYIDEETLDHEDTDYEMEFIKTEPEDEDKKVMLEPRQLRQRNGSVSTDKVHTKLKSYIPNDKNIYPKESEINPTNKRKYQRRLALTSDIDEVELKAEREAQNIKTLELFTTVQRMQRQVVGLRDKLRRNMKLLNRQRRGLEQLQETIGIKKKALEQKRKKKSRILLTIQDKIKEDKEGLILAMPGKQTEDAKDFALSIYKFSPQAYIYIRNSLRTMLPSTDILESWISSGCQPKNIIMNNNLIKLVSEQTEKELSCKIIVG